MKKKDFKNINNRLQTRLKQIFKKGKNKYYNKTKDKKEEQREKNRQDKKNKIKVVSSVYFIYGKDKDTWTGVEVTDYNYSNYCT